jgi:hypothetical protein
MQIVETEQSGPQVQDFDPTRHSVESRRLAAVNGWAVDGSPFVARQSGQQVEAHTCASTKTRADANDSTESGASARVPMRAGGLCAVPKAAKIAKRRGR